MVFEGILANKCMLNFNNGNNRRRCEICSELTIKTPSGVSIIDFEPINVWWYSHDTKIKADQILIIETYYRLNVYYHLSSRRGKSGTWKQFVFVIAVNTFYTMLKITSKLTFLHFSSGYNCLSENWNCPRIDQYPLKSLIEKDYSEIWERSNNWILWRQLSH